MSWQALGHFLKDAAPVVAMFTSLFLLWQGQQDRRRLALERRRGQVDRLLLSDTVRTSDPTSQTMTVREVFSSTLDDLTVRNESDAALKVYSVTEVYPEGIPAPGLAGEVVSPFTSQLDPHQWPALLKPGDEREMELTPGWSLAQGAPQPPYVVVDVRDASGRRWLKRSDTATSKLVRMDRKMPWRAHLALWLERHWWGRPCWWVLYGPLDRRLSGMRDRDPERSPGVIRLSRWVWGRWDVGINDPWLYPGIVPWKSARRKKQ